MATEPAERDAPEQEGRRARQRRELLAAIEVEARRLLVEGGAGTVSMRAIARAVGVAPASLYTYFGGLDDVFTMLLLSSYGRLADATRAAATELAGSPPADRAFAAILAHRRWALDNPNEFNLLFVDIIPGYEAPEGGPTVDAQTQVFLPMIEAFLELHDPGDIRAVAGLMVPLWSAFHGAVMLEINHHLDWLGDTAGLHEQTVRAAMAAMGLPAPAPDVRARFDTWIERGSRRRRPAGGRR